jgi:hypothetical protein
MDAKKIIVEPFGLRNVLQILGIILVAFVLINIGYTMYYLSEDQKISNVMTTYKKEEQFKLKSRKFNYNNCMDDYKDRYLSDFYIASSSMSFLVGNQRFDYANIEMLKNCLIMGARYIELEIINDSFSQNAKPIVTTGYKDGQWQTSLNNIDFEQACDVLANYAFQPDIRSNEFPLFIYLKLKINNYAPTLSKIANIIRKKFPSKKEKNLESGNRIDFNINPADTKLCSLFNQVIIWSDPVIFDENLSDDDKNLIKSFTETVNKYPPIRIHHTKLSDYRVTSSDRKPKTPADYLNDQDSLTEYNRNKLSIVYPHNEDDIKTINYDPDEAWSYGCQFVGINYQLNDDNRRLYFDKFKMDSMVLKPEVLRRIIPEKKVVSIDTLVPETKEQSDYVKRQLAFIYKDQPICLRPYNEPGKVLTIEEGNLVVKDKREDELDVIDAFLIQPSLNNRDNNLIISLESVRYPNKYLIYDGSDFTIQDWRIHKFEDDSEEFVNNSSYIPMKPFTQTRSNIKEDTSNMISFYVQNRKYNIMTYNSTKESITVEEDDSQNFELANRGTFIINKLKVQGFTNIRQLDGMYVHQEKSLLVKKKIDLDPNGLFEFSEEKTLNDFPLIKENFIHIKDYKGNYWTVDGHVLRSNQKTPNQNTRFIIEENDDVVKIIFGGNEQKLPLITQSDGILRLSYNTETESPNTQFILGMNYKKSN